MVNSTGALRIGGNSIWSEWFQGRIDEVRVYRRTLTAAEIQADMNAAGRAARHARRRARSTGLTATGGLGQAQLSWTAATDNIGVARYNVHRGASAGFTPSAANRVAQVTGTTYTDAGMAAGDHYYRVIAEDARRQRRSGRRTRRARPSRPTPPRPRVSLTAPAGGATVTGTIDVTASAADNVGVAGVQFRLDGADLGAEDTSGALHAQRGAAPRCRTASTRLTAVARDAAGNRTTAQPVTVTVDNPPVDTSGLVGRLGLRGGHRHHRRRTRRRAGNDGTMSGASWTDAGRFGRALSFDGVDDLVTRGRRRLARPRARR